MKKIHIKLFTALLAVALVAGVTLFYSCKKEEEKPTKPQEKVKIDFSRIDFNKIGKTTSNSKTGTAMLVFVSNEDYISVLEALQDICSEYTQEFIRNLIIANGGNDDENFINNLLDSLGFNPFYPLHEFSDILSFVGLYLNLEEAEERWKVLAGNIEDNPFAERGVGCFESALFNVDGDVMIEDEVYNAGNDGLFPSPKSFNCNNETHTKTSPYYTYSSVQRYVFGFLRTNKLNTLAYTRTYYKKNNGNWGNWFTKIRVQVGGTKSKKCDDYNNNQTYTWPDKTRSLPWGFYVEAWLYSPSANSYYRLPSGEGLGGKHWEDASTNSNRIVKTKV